MTVNAKRFNMIGGLLVVVLLVVAGIALYIRLANAGANQNDASEPYDTFDELAQIIETGNAHPNGMYVSTLTLGGTVLESEVYHFAGNAIQVQMYAYCEGGEGASDYFMVELHRVEAGVVDVLVGSQTLSRRGMVIADWQDVPEGDYYFVFSKDADNQIVKSENVTMQGYITTNEQAEGL